MKAAHNRPLSEKEPEPAVGAETEIRSSDQPLLVLRYRGHQQFLRIVPFLFVHLLLGFGLLLMIFKPDEFLFKRPFMAVGCILLFPLTAVSVFEFLLFEEIRLYKDRMVKVRHMLGTVEVALKNAF